MLFQALITSLGLDTIMCVPGLLTGSDVDSHCWIHHSFWSHVRQDVEGARHLQKCEDEEEGREMLYDVCFFYVRGTQSD